MAGSSGCDLAVGSGGKLLRRHHEATADGVKSALGERASVLAKSAKDHPICVAGQRRPVVEAEVRRRIERDLGQPVAGERFRVGELRQDRRDGIRIDAVGRLPGEPERNGTVGAVTLAGKGERAVQADGDTARCASEGRDVFGEEAARGDHRPDRVRAGGADPDLEHVEDAEEHRAPSQGALLRSKRQAGRAFARDRGCRSSADQGQALK